MAPLHGVSRRFDPYRNHQLFNEKIMSSDTRDLIQQHYIRVVHLFNKDHPMGGTTIAYKPEQHRDGYPTGKFARVAVAYCNKKDRYSRRLGEELAVNNLMAGEFMLLPIYKYGKPVITLKQIFVDTLYTMEN